MNKSKVASGNKRLSRVRGQNFTKEEKCLLLQLVSEHKKVLEIKKTDAVSVAMKATEWAKIHHKFNFRSVDKIHREAKQLRTAYDTIIKTRQKRAKNKDVDSESVIATETLLAYRRNPSRNCNDTDTGFNEEAEDIDADIEQEHIDINMEPERMNINMGTARIDVNVDHQLLDGASIKMHSCVDSKQMYYQEKLRMERIEHRARLEEIQRRTEILALKKQIALRKLIIIQKEKENENQ